ncbi:MAG: hypothetical protein SOU08_06630 [Anaerococcus sp.]|nr:hypothetical protein [Anaerococcus sp.]MDD7044784.1 hypothetical protein [Peptoniphilaceae bacterium]MDY2919295.1 hypothetical protein [Anaerococcus sp.]
MNFLIDDKAKTFLDKKNIREIYVNPDLDTKGACCGPGVCDFVVTTKEDNKDNYKKERSKDIDIFYHPNLTMFFEDSEEILISAFGLGPIKKLYVANEKNLLY